jgi:hypothetical protein
MSTVIAKHGISTVLGLVTQLESADCHLLTKTIKLLCSFEIDGTLS